MPRPQLFIIRLHAISQSFFLFFPFNSIYSFTSPASPHPPPFVPLLGAQPLVTAARALAFGALAVALVVVVVVLLTGSGGHRYHLVFQNAGPHSPSHRWRSFGNTRSPIMRMFFIARSCGMEPN